MTKNEILPNIWLFDSEKPWYTVTLMAWVHGNEKSWQILLWELLQSLEIISGKVIVIPEANPRAVAKNVRQTEKNMNRAFHDIPLWNAYEDMCAQELLPTLRQSDILLDIHNTLNTENSIPFLISEHTEWDKYFPVKTVVRGLDTLHPGGSDWYMNCIGKVWLCIESGSIYDPRWTEIARESVMNFLRATGNIAWEPNISNHQDKYILLDIVKAKSTNVSFVKNYLDFEQVYAGEIVGYDDGEPIVAPYDGIIVFTYLPKQIGDEVCVFGKRE